MNAAHFGGANMYVQWYCAPEMGQIEAISASEAANASVPEIERSIP